MANVSRDVMNRTLARFKSLGWIATNYNRVKILDLRSLSEFASGIRTTLKRRPTAPPLRSRDRDPGIEKRRQRS
jgi:hypothetical protein